MDPLRDFICIARLAGLNGPVLQKWQDCHMEVTSGFWEGHQVSALVAGAGQYRAVTYQVVKDGVVLAESNSLKEALDTANPNFREWYLARRAARQQKPPQIPHSAEYLEHRLGRE